LNLHDDIIVSHRKLPDLFDSQFLKLPKIETGNWTYMMILLSHTGS